MTGDLEQPAAGTCGHTWRDGWGAHQCLKREHPESPRHHCACDASTYTDTPRTETT